MCNSGNMNMLGCHRIYFGVQQVTTLVTCSYEIECQIYNFRNRTQKCEIYLTKQTTGCSVIDIATTAGFKNLTSSGLKWMKEIY